MTELIAKPIVKNQFWIVTDVINNKPASLEIRQIWHTRFDNIKFISDSSDMIVENGYVSEYYGEKKDCKQIVIKSLGSAVNTDKFIKVSATLPCLLLLFFFFFYQQTVKWSVELSPWTKG